MTSRTALSNLGVYVYAGAAVSLGVIGLVWSDFAMNWQRVPADVPHREALAYIAAVFELCAGVAMLWRRSARVCALALTLLYSLFTLSWVRQSVRVPQIYDGWGNVFEELSLVIAGLLLYAYFAPSESAWAGKKALISRLYGICVISFGVAHFVYLKAAATFVPKWIPPGQMFWVVTTGISFLLSASALLLGIQAPLASRLLTAQIVGFEILVWAPKLFTAPHEHFSWSGNGISMALAGAAWVVADVINDARQGIASPQV